MTHGLDLRDTSLPAATIRQALALARHPEGGHYREVWRAPARDGERGAGSSIMFLLADGEYSRWHRIDAAETWLWQAGAPLQLEIAVHDQLVNTAVLGPAIDRREKLQVTVPIGAWQAAASLGAWTLVACVVAPAFEFAGFELAPHGWSPD